MEIAVEFDIQVDTDPKLISVLQVEPDWAGHKEQVHFDHYSLS